MILIYGATGYTGQLVLDECLASGVRPVLAGRKALAVKALAEPHALEWRVASLDDAAALDIALRGARVVIHCAGPFARTSRRMADACLRGGVHYLDITGEIAVFEALAARDAEAKAAGVMLLPGVGFDVVPSDCLAAHLKRRLPSATSLTLAFHGGTGLSRGTATSTSVIRKPTAAGSPIPPFTPANTLASLEVMEMILTSVLEPSESVAVTVRSLAKENRPSIRMKSWTLTTTAPSKSSTREASL